jgi:hypothetical protein
MCETGFVNKKGTISISQDNISQVSRAGNTPTAVWLLKFKEQNNGKYSEKAAQSLDVWEDDMARYPTRKDSTKTTEDFRIMITPRGIGT